MTNVMKQGDNPHYSNERVEAIMNSSTQYEDKIMEGIIWAAMGMGFVLALKAINTLGQKCQHCKQDKTEHSHH